MNRHPGWMLVFLGTTVMLLGSYGCTSSKADGDPWSTHYVGSPDDVWVAIHMALIELDYDVESENREDGIVRAVREGDDENSTVVLSLDQIMRSEEIRVYVRIGAGPDSPAMARDRQETYAKEFLALLNGVLYK